MNRLEAPNPRVYRNTERVVRTAALFMGGITWTGIGNIPRGEAAILSANHTSPLDPPILGSVVRHATKDHIHFLAMKELWEKRITIDLEGNTVSNPFYRPTGRFLNALGAIPLDKEKMPSKEVLSQADYVIENNGLLGIFPEGGLRHEPTVTEIKIGAVMMASRHGTPIVPVGIAGADIKGIVGEERDFGHFHVHFGSPIEVPEAEWPRQALRVGRELTPVLLEGMQDALATAKEIRSNE